MLTDETIRQLATVHQTTELNIRREYVQHLFLSFFYQQAASEHIYFKGGTALRIIYLSPRFSEDLDFSSSLSEIKPIEKLVVNTLAEIERLGITTNLQEAKSTSGGYLSIAQYDLQGHSISTQLEVSLRSPGQDGEVTTIASDFVPPYTIIQLAQNKLIEEKIQALLSRQKPRDFYDLYFMIRANLLSHKEKKLVPAVLEALERSTLNFSKELKMFLPKSQWILIRDFPATLKRELKKYI